MFEFIVTAGLVVGIPLLFLAGVRTALARGAADEMPAWYRGLWQGRPLATGWYVIAGIIGLVLLLVALNDHPRGPRNGDDVFFVFVVGVMVLAVFAHAWRREFLFLMSRRDDEFPGRFDKFTWTLVLTLLGPVGLWIFRGYRVSHWPEPKIEEAGGRSAAELS